MAPRRSTRHLANRALLRARFRIAFFVALAGLCALLGHTAAIAIALVGVACGLCSLGVARRGGSHWAHSFVVLDWLIFGCAVALAGQSESWLLVTVPFLVAGHLGLSPYAEWPYLLSPAVLLVAVLGIADPSFAGHTLISVTMVSALVGGGAIAAQRLKLGRKRRDQRRRFDPVSGFYSTESFQEIGAARFELAAARGQTLSLVYVRLDGVQAIGRLHAHSRDALVKRAAAAVKVRMQDGDLAFRLGAADFAVLLAGRSRSDAQRFAAEAASTAIDGIAGGRRLELSTGTSCFPEHLSLEDLLRAARESARATVIASPEVGASSAKLAAAQ